MRSSLKRLVECVCSNAVSRILTRRTAPTAGRQRTFFEGLEGRILLAAFNPLPSAVDGSPGSLRSAIIIANSNNQDDTINLSAGTYTLSVVNGVAGQENAAARGDLDLTERNTTITIVGAGNSQTIIDGGAIDRVFQVFPDVTVIFRDVTITNGRARDDGTVGVGPDETEAMGGAVLNNRGTVTLENVAILQNRADGGTGTAATGAGGFLLDPAEPGMDAEGGGVASISGTLTLTGTTHVAFNEAKGGTGGGAVVLNLDEVAPGAEGGSAAGGGIFIAGGTLTIDLASAGSLFENNATGGAGGTGVLAPLVGLSGAGLPGEGYGGGFYNYHGVATINALSAQSNAADFGGGLVNDDGVISITNSRIDGNLARIAGGGILVGASANPFNPSTVTLEFSSVDGNIMPSTGEGGAGGIQVRQGGKLIVTDSSISGNVSNASTGGVTSESGSTTVLTRSYLISNRGVVAGGIANNGTLTITDSFVSDNTATGSQQSQAKGGGLLNNGPATVTGTEFISNSAQTVVGGPPSIGGGIYNAATLTITRNNTTLGLNVIGLNSASFGGGIYNEGTDAILNVDQTTFSVNNAGSQLGGPGDGGGLWNGNQATITHSTFVNNSAANAGGAIFNGSSFFAGQLEVTNSTIHENGAGNRGGGVYNIDGAQSRLFNSTITLNQAGQGGGVYTDISTNALLFMTNSILAGNVNPGVAPTSPDIFGGIERGGLSGAVYIGYNLVQSTIGLAGILAPSDLSGVDPLLGPLQDNGGSTYTRAPLEGSPVIDSGRDPGNPKTMRDQRGQLRPTDDPNQANAIGGDGSDIGAVEVSLAETDEVDLSVSQAFEMAGPVVAGSGAGNLVYRVTLTNSGAKDATGVRLSHALTLPAGVTVDSTTPGGGSAYDPATGAWTVDNLPAGTSQTLRIVLTVGSSTAIGTDTITSNAMVTATDQTRINTVDDTSALSASVEHQFDLWISHYDITYLPNGQAAITIGLGNYGPSDATDVQVSISRQLPTGVSVASIEVTAGTGFDPASQTWYVGQLPLGSTVFLTTYLDIDETAVLGSTIISDAEIIHAGGTFLDTSDDSALRPYFVAARNATITSVTLDSANASAIQPGDPVSLAATFAHEGSTATHTATIDWGDGTTTNGAVNGNTISGSHTYSGAGRYAVSVTVNDNLGGQTVQTADALVSGVSVNNGVLQIIGTDGNDSIKVALVNKTGEIKVTSKIEPGIKFRSFPGTSVNRIEMVLGDGDDKINVNKKITDPLYVDGGAGNDKLKGAGGVATLIGGDGNDSLAGGDADALLIGGAGNDSIKGGKGRNLIVGGAGADKLTGGKLDDLLVAGHITLTEVDLAGLFAEWVANRSFVQRVNNLMGVGGPPMFNAAYLIVNNTVSDDDDQDSINGGKGLDWLLASTSSDKVSGKAFASNANDATDKIDLLTAL